jgi:gas vesicle structural protein
VNETRGSKEVTSMSIQASSTGSAVERSQESQLADVVSTILDKGVVVDIFARVSVVGIEVLRVDVRVVIASIDTYLRFAEAVNRLDMGSNEPAGLPEVVEDVSEAGSKAIAKGKSRGAIDAGIDKLQELLEPDGKEEAESASA